MLQLVTVTGAGIGIDPFIITCNGIASSGPMYSGVSIVNNTNEGIAT